jgi:hypothetical protein
VYETASLLNLDAVRLRAIGENLSNPPLPPDGQFPKVDADSMTAADQGFADLITDLLPRAQRLEGRLPYSDVAAFAHNRLADLDAMVAFLLAFGDHVRTLLRPPYAAFAELAEQPPADPAPERRDPRVHRDRLHDMRMPPYMRDSDATALSLTRRQYLQILALIDRLEQQARQAVAARAPAAAKEAAREALAAHAALLGALPGQQHAAFRLLAGAEAAAPAVAQPLPPVETPIRRRVATFLEARRRLAEGGAAAQPLAEVPPP